MKKVTSLLLVAALILSLAACGAKEPNPLVVPLPEEVVQPDTLEPQEVESTPTQDDEEPSKVLSPEEIDAATMQDNEQMNRVTEALQQLVLTEYNPFTVAMEEFVYDANFSCYSDSAIPDSAIISSKNDGWRYDMSQLSTTNALYLPNGKMQGATLTFSPVKTENATEFHIRDARVNEMVEGWPNGFMSLDTMSLNDVDEAMCDQLCDIVGEKIVLQSPCYSNSSFTIFINFDIWDVYGMWNGVNLEDGMKYDDEQLKSLNLGLDNEAIKISKDSHLLGTIVNTVKYVSIGDVRYELLDMACVNNVSCYLETSSEKMCPREKISLGEDRDEKDYAYDVDNVLVYGPGPVCQYVGGSFTGVTITFTPQKFGENDVRYTWETAEINKFFRNDAHYTEDRVAGEMRYRNKSVTLDRSTPQYLSEESLLYSRLKEVLGDEPIRLYSALGQNSEYTIFIGISGHVPNFYVYVYGQWANNILQ